jgi:hypothetical protein
MDTPPPYGEQSKVESARKDLFEHYFHLDERWHWRITQEGANLAKEQFIQSVKRALTADQPISWGLLLQVLYEYLGVNVDVKTGVGSFPHMKRMAHLLDFDLSKKEEQSGLASLMLGAYSNSEVPSDAPQDISYDGDRDVMSFFIRYPLEEEGHLEKNLQRQFHWNLEIWDASSKEKRRFVPIGGAIENPSQDVQEKFEAQRI